MSAFVRTLWLCTLSAALGACGGGDSGPNRYTVSTETGSGGALSPVSREIEQDLTGRFIVNPEEGYELQGIRGCAGTFDRGTYTTGEVTGDCVVRATFALSEYELDTFVVGSGTLSPELRTVTIEDEVTLTAVPDQDSRLVTIAGCGGLRQGNTYTVSDVVSDCTVTAWFEPEVYSVSGTLSATALNQFDSTLNDAAAPLVNNSTFSEPQLINNRATLAGFASAEPADLAPAFPAHFSDTTDPSDFYRVSLQEGQVIQLQVVDFAPPEPGEGERYNGDLDLYLFNTTEESELSSSTGTGEFEELIVPESGDYLIEVRAHSGTAKYVLRLRPEDSALQTDLSQTQSGDFVPGEMLVRPAQLSARSQTRGSPPLVHLERSAPALSIARAGTALQVLQQRNPAAYEKLQTLQAIKARRADPKVAHAEPNYRRYPLRVPNDPRYNLQWHYDAINLPRAWDLTTGVPEDGSSAPIVAVVDTGVVLEHPDLQAKLVSGYDFIRNLEQANDGDGIDPDPSDPGDADDLNPDSWHGTHVAGTIGADSDNGSGGAGVSWGARIMPLRALGVGGGSSYDIIQSVLYAAGLENDSGTLPSEPADIINLSLGGEGNSQTEADLYAAVRDLGVIIVASSGNENSSTPLYPASYPAVFSVGATTATGARAPYSNFGETLDLVAPGGNLREDANGDAVPDGILSTSAERNGGVIQPGYSLNYQGTSMAAPHVAGVFALMKAVYPELTPAQLAELLTTGALTGQSERTMQLGYGQIDAERATAVAFELANGAQFDWPPRVAVQPSRLNLGTTSEALVTLTNEGEGQVEQIGVTTDADWLSVESTEETQANGLGDYRVLVDRTALDDSTGFYQGQARFTINAETSVNLEVFIEVGEVSSAGVLTRTYVLLVDEEDPDNTAYQTIAVANDSDEEAAFVFPEIPPGRYSLVAGSDIDADGIICQTGEQCGAFPNLEREQIIEVSDQNRSNLDFTLGILGGLLDNSAQANDDSVSQLISIRRLPIETQDEKTGQPRQRSSQD